MNQTDISNFSYINISQEILLAVTHTKRHTVFTRLQAGAFIYLESTFDPAFIRGRRLFETGLYCFQYVLNDSISTKHR